MHIVLSLRNGRLYGAEALGKESIYRLARALSYVDRFEIDHDTSR